MTEIHIERTPGQVIQVALDGNGGGTIKSEGIKEEEPIDAEDETFNAAVAAVETLILSHAVEGVDVGSEAYRSGITATLESLERSFGRSPDPRTSPVLLSSAAESHPFCGSFISSPVSLP